ncbi:MAG: YlqD family protein, partial [Candidatus Eremiobacteraeota bacterium]|nr:YlqD family protein [Candidatus Eremiobacteraeota bacterium]
RKSVRIKGGAMASIDIKRPVVVKVIMTEAFRAQLVEEARQTIKNIEENLDNMEMEARKQIATMEISNPHQASMLTQQLEAEKERLIRMRGELDWRIREVQNVEIGTELPFRVFEGSVTINEGDNFLEKMSQTEVVIKDWKVMEIREPATQQSG